MTRGSGSSGSCSKGSSAATRCASRNPSSTKPRTSWTTPRIRRCATFGRRTTTPRSPSSSSRQQRRCSPLPRRRGKRRSTHTSTGSRRFPMSASRSATSRGLVRSTNRRAPKCGRRRPPSRSAPVTWRDRRARRPPIPIRGRSMYLAVIALALLATCVIVQSVGMLLLIHWLARVRHILESPRTPSRVMLLLRLFVAIVLLHLIQIGLWASVFWQAGELPTLETAVYLSFATYTTIGFGDVVLGPRSPPPTAVHS